MFGMYPLGSSAWFRVWVLGCHSNPKMVSLDYNNETQLIILARVPQAPLVRPYWVAFKELKLSYQNMGT